MHYQNQQRKKFKIKFQVLLKFAQILLDCTENSKIQVLFKAFKWISSNFQGSHEKAVQSLMYLPGLCIHEKMNYSILFDAISLEWSIVYNKG